ncbi:MAG: hypothetical protein AAFZ01_14290 [Pseudomonadota bacterium]
MAQQAVDEIELPARNLVGRCGRLAARPGLGPEFDVGVGLGRIDTRRAVQTCSDAVRAFSGIAGPYFHLGRAHFAATRYAAAMAPL